MAKGTGRGLTVNRWMFVICKKNIIRTENSQVTTGVNNLTLYISTEWNFRIEDSFKLVDLLSAYDTQICVGITPFFFCFGELRLY